MVESVTYTGQRGRWLNLYYLYWAKGEMVESLLLILGKGEMVEICYLYWAKG